jgi:hypothetical protein
MRNASRVLILSGTVHGTHSGLRIGQCPPQVRRPVRENGRSARGGTRSLREVGRDGGPFEPRTGFPTPVRISATWLVDATEPRIATNGYDACIVCASIHQGKQQSAVMHFVRDTLAFLDAVPLS